jgi:hypothetical protein
MTPAQVKNIRRLTGRCEANIEELVNLLSKSTDNYALRCAAWVDLAALLLSDIEACQAQQQAAVEAARAAEREQCCKDICYGCSKGVPVFKKYGNRWWHDMTPGLEEYGCAATAMRQRAAKE